MKLFFIRTMRLCSSYYQKVTAHYSTLKSDFALLFILLYGISCKQCYCDDSEPKPQKAVQLPLLFLLEFCDCHIKITVNMRPGISVALVSNQLSDLWVMLYWIIQPLANPPPNHIPWKRQTEISLFGLD
jgi:hypothetical protein